MELDMTKGSPFKLIFKFILPVVAGNLFQQLYNMVDTIIVGKFVGLDALAAVGATGTITFLIIGFAMGLSAGFAVVISQKFGAGDREGVKVATFNSIALTVGLTVIITLISVLSMRWLLTVMNTPENVFQMSYDYIIIITGGLFFTMLYNVCAGLLRAVGDSRTPLYFLIISATLNVGLDLLLIIVFKMGVRGAAIATIASQGVSGALCLIYIFKKVKVIVPERKHMHMDRQIATNQLKIGVPMALQYSITAIGTIMIQAALNLFGSTVMGSYTAANKVCQFITLPYSALGVTMSTYCAQNRGINDIDRIRKGVRSANVLSAVYSVSVFLLSIPLFPMLLKLFVDSSADFAQVLEYAKVYYYRAGVCFIPLGMIFIQRNAMQGCGFSFSAMMGGIVELVSRGIIAKIAVARMSFAGVCLGDPLTWFITAVFFVVAYFMTIRSMKRSKEAYEAGRGSNRVYELRRNKGVSGATE
ncbi:MAG: MATE family efflux transporter [Lachnospiraceae bacterium]|nr:MATE family efflux transporter [Lachnospiraceae bacterium]